MTPIATLIKHRTSIINACKQTIEDDEAVEIKEALYALMAPERARTICKGREAAKRDGSYRGNLGELIGKLCDAAEGI